MWTKNHLWEVLSSQFSSTENTDNRDWHFGFETFAKSLRVSVSENLVSEKKSRFRFRKNLVSEKSLGFGKFGFVKKVPVSVSEKFGLGKKPRFRFRFQKNLVSEKSLGFGFGKFGFGKKSRFRFRKNLVSEKSIGFGFGKFGIVKKSLGIGFGQNFGIVIQ